MILLSPFHIHLKCEFTHKFKLKSLAPSGLQSILILWLSALLSCLCLLSVSLTVGLATDYFRFLLSLVSAVAEGNSTPIHSTNALLLRKQSGFPWPSKCGHQFVHDPEDRSILFLQSPISSSANCETQERHLGLNMALMRHGSHLTEK